jgi:hypothetical protein
MLTLQEVLLQVCNWYQDKLLSVSRKLHLSSIATVGTEGPPKEHDVKDLPDRVRPVVMTVFFFVLVCVQFDI